MRTNGCTMAYWQNRQSHVCENHARMTRDETTPYLKPGTAMARPAAYTATGPRGVWMKGATWRAVKVDVGAQRRALDAFAARKIAYDAATVIRRRKAN